MAKSKTIARVHVGDEPERDYITAFMAICDAILSVPLETKESLTQWYENRHKTTPNAASDYVNTLFSGGLLRDDENGIACPFDVRSRGASRKIIEALDRNVVFVVGMLEATRDGATQQEVMAQGKELYGLSAQEISYRKGWLRSAEMLEHRQQKLWTTEKGKRLLNKDGLAGTDSIRPKPVRDTNRREFGGKGEGREHKTLKEYVKQNIERVLKAAGLLSEPVNGCEVEHKLPSGDSVDVTGLSNASIWHIEVKSKISGDADVERGLYQCIKYGAVEEARVRLGQWGSGKGVKTLLVVEAELSPKLRELAKDLGIQAHVLGKGMRKELQRQRKGKRRG